MIDHDIIVTHMHAENKHPYNSLWSCRVFENMNNDDSLIKSIWIQ